MHRRLFVIFNGSDNISAENDDVAFGDESCVPRYGALVLKMIMFFFGAIGIHRCHLEVVRALGIVRS